MIEGTNLEKKDHKWTAIMTPVTFFLRRIAFVISVVTLKDCLWGQIATQNFIALFMVIFLQWFKPLDSKFSNNMETFNECTCLALTYILICFSDFVPEPEMRHYMGNYYIALTLGNIGIHLLFLFA